MRQTPPQPSGTPKSRLLSCNDNGECSSTFGKVKNQLSSNFMVSDDNPYMAALGACDGVAASSCSPLLYNVSHAPRLAWIASYQHCIIISNYMPSRGERPIRSLHSQF